MTSEHVAPKPNDLASPRLTPDDCFIFGEECDYGIQDATRPRATATRLFADEMGVDFNKVSCRVGYLRLLTRQESYETRAMDDAMTSWIYDHTPPLSLSNGQWATEDGTVVTPPKELDVVPDDWKPDEDDSVWSFCEKTDPGAVRCWRLEFKPGADR